MSTEIHPRVNVYRVIVGVGLALLMVRVLLAFVPCGWIYVGAEAPSGGCAETLRVSESFMYGTFGWMIVGMGCLVGRLREEQSKAD
jgi:hypothetical protein